MSKWRKYVAVATVAAVMTFGLVGCGNKDNKNGPTTESNKTEADSDTQGDSPVDDLEGAADDVGDAVGDAATDVGEGVGDALGAGTGSGTDDASSGFDNYDDAKTYFMKRMAGADSKAQYEVRNESKDLVSYDNKNQGYSFELYDTSKDSKGTKIGQFYIDSKDGSVHKKNDKSNKVEAYQFNDSENSNTDTKK